MKQKRKDFALGRLPRGQMNKTENEYSLHLEFLKGAGKILSWDFERVRLVLAPGVSYTPDFMVLMADRTIEMHEVKGHWTDDAKAKIRIASNLFPFRFVSVHKRAKRDGGGWELIEQGVAHED